MGAEMFQTVGFGKDAKEAFYKAVDMALYENGHGGYTGSIAEKNSFVMIPCPDRKSPSSFANRLIEDDDPRISDKWGPAGCVDVTAEKRKLFRKVGMPWKRGQKAFLFFGYASS